MAVPASRKHGPSFPVRRSTGLDCLQCYPTAMCVEVECAPERHTRSVASWSAIHTTRLETRTKEYCIYASGRDEISNA